MKRIICFFIIIFIVISVFAETITLPSAEATIKYDLVTSAYLFGFSDTLEHAQAKTDAYTEKEEYSLSMVGGSGMSISGGTGTLYFYWKVLTGENLQITLTSKGPLVHTSVGTGTPTTEQKIDYEVRGSSTTIWNGGSLGGKINTSSSTDNAISALLKRNEHTAIYTEGICELVVRTTSDVKTKEYGSYESTLVLTISNQS